LLVRPALALIQLPGAYDVQSEHRIIRRVPRWEQHGIAKRRRAAKIIQDGPGSHSVVAIIRAYFVADSRCDYVGEARGRVLHGVGCHMRKPENEGAGDRRPPKL